MKIRTALFLLLSVLVATIQAQTPVNKTDKKTDQITFHVGMHCQACKDRIEKYIPMEKGVKDLKVDLDKKEVTIVFNPQKTTVEKLKKAVEILGYTCEKKE
ncbi:MAG: heavy-metal-associated domain-containing protein [Bacteroidota bacterium]|nr:heavy-metal-associated domain-containing protein [Bacteroidota bacterium]